MARRKFEQVEAVESPEIAPDEVVIPAGPVEASAPPAAIVETPAPSVVAQRAALVDELAELARLKETYEAAKAVYNDACKAVDEAEKLYLAKSDAWDAMNRAQIAHDHAQPRVRELTKALEALSV